MLLSVSFEKMIRKESDCSAKKKSLTYYALRALNSGLYLDGPPRVCRIALFGRWRIRRLSRRSWEWEGVGQ